MAARGSVAAAILIGLAVLIAVKHDSFFSKRPQNAENVWVKTNIVIPSMERSANANDQKAIILTRLPQELTIDLPLGSQSGMYEIQLRRNERTVLSTSANAEIHSGETALTIRTDLSQWDAGNYLMAIRRAPDDWDVYPVLIR
jgi:hypothetical protein